MNRKRSGKIRAGRDEREVIEITDGAVGARRIHDQAHHMGAGGECDVCLGQSAPGLPTAAVGVGHGTGFVDAVEFDMKSAAVAAGRDASLKGVYAVHESIDGVVE